MKRVSLFVIMFLECIQFSIDRYLHWKWTNLCPINFRTLNDYEWLRFKHVRLRRAMWGVLWHPFFLIFFKNLLHLHFQHFFLLLFIKFPSNSLLIFKLQSYTLHGTSKQKIKSTKKWVFLEICVNERWEKTFFWILFKIGFCEIIITECPSVHWRSLRKFFPQVMSKKFHCNFLS